MEKNYEEIFNLAREYRKLDMNVSCMNGQEIKIKNNNEKIKNIIKEVMFNKYNEIYGSIINQNELKIMIDLCVSSYSEEEGVNLLISSEFKIKAALDAYLANMYKDNIDNEIGLNILILTEEIYSKEIANRYKNYSKEQISTALEETLNTYDGEKTFFINTMMNLKSHKR